jgi:hypothetical protein
MCLKRSRRKHIVSRSAPCKARCWTRIPIGKKRPVSRAVSLWMWNLLRTIAVTGVRRGDARSPLAASSVHSYSDNV